MKRDYWIFIIFIALCLLYVFIYPQTGNLGVPNQDHVVLISVDGLRSDALREMGEKALPNFYFLLKNGASTLNARSDADWTLTLPGHTCMFTGLPVSGESGHHVEVNELTGDTLESLAGRPVKTAFDVVHDAGLRTAFFASKEKFRFFVQSFGPKLDKYRLTSFDDKLTFGTFLEELIEEKPNFSFVHLSLPDSVGHRKSWRVSPNSEYLRAVKEVDQLLGVLLGKIRNDEVLKDLTVIVLTTDHGGYRRSHEDARNPYNFTIPFIVWGDGVAEGTDLYELNRDTRADPANIQPGYDIHPQPIRNGDAANLVLDLLDLPPLPGSVMNFKQDLRISAPQALPEAPPAPQLDALPAL